MFFAAAIATAGAQSSVLSTSTMMPQETQSSEVVSSITPTSAPKSTINSTSTLSTATTTLPWSAQTTVLEIVQMEMPDIPALEGWSPITSIRGSIVDANALATTIAIECLPNATRCAGETQTITEGPSTYAKTMVVTLTDPYDITMSASYDCQVSASSYMTCTDSITVSLDALGTETKTQTVITTTYGPADATHRPLTITGGISKLHRPKATQTPTAAAGRPGIGGAAAAAAAGAVVGFF
ncbi:hypothetical protein PHISP_04057 [Aspergillus sp. HF37]|nr:hypothetical protein PHISP_04057 [Aspergillus sp. HF37]